MEPKILRYALMVSNEKSFSKAAKKLHLSQPSLSYQISKLENDLGVELFKRGKKGIQLTYAGICFTNRATEIVDQFKQLKDEMIDFADMNKGQLLIGSLSVTGAFLLPEAISRFRKKYPGIEIALIEDSSVNLESFISHGQIEMGLLSMPVINNELDFETILEEDILLVVPSAHPLSKLQEVDLFKCKDDNFILLKNGTGFRSTTELLCYEAGFEPKIAFESININTCLSLVSSGIGITFAPKMVIKEFSYNTTNDLVYLPINHSVKPTRRVIFAYKKERYLSRAAHSFINITKELAATL
ncbi:LysR family transcriptional regulator [Lentibacillus jeotgali]|uniref:LysR family transcriptional regulator n=1 Tax=Lentibacillus jeotgali TaxID=558169 RepID=UPI00026287C7|nr:LysR family transcriptional regulator [Lentibacillus jeotgali]